LREQKTGFAPLFLNEERIIMSSMERVMSKLVGKFVFSGLWTDRPYLILILISLIFFLLYIVRRRREAFSSNLIGSFSGFFSFFFFVEGPEVASAMEKPPGPGPSDAGPSGSAACNPGPSADRGEPSSAPLPGGQPEFGDNSAPSRPVSPSDLRAMEELFHIEEEMKPIIRGMHRELGARHVGELQAVHLIDDLVDRHGAEHMPEILRSFREKGASSPYFRYLYNDFMNLRATKGTEENLHKEYMGRKVFRGSRRGGH
jgi:hypothetical protein